MKNTIKIMMAALTLVFAMSLTTGVTAEAKAYKAKTVTVTKGKSKTIKTSRKIKKVKISSKNKNFKVKKTAAKKFKVSKTDKGKKQTVKVTYTNKNTQTFKITTKAAKKTKKSIPSYAKKIVKELKPLLADPDKGLQTALAGWLKRLNPRKSLTYKFKLGNWKYGLGASISSLTVEEVLKTYTTSQKKALILEVYIRQRMSYSFANEGKYCHTRFRGENPNPYFKKLYNGAFKGVCSDGARMAYDICRYLGIKAKCVSSDDLDHEWACIWAKGKNGTSYWHGIYTTSYPYSMKASIPAGDNGEILLTEAQVKKYVCSPNASTHFMALKRKIINKPTPKPTVTPAPTIKPTVTPAQTPTGTQGQRIVIPFAEHQYTCPGCSVPYRHKSSNNPYITNGITEVGSYKVYKHSTPTGIRYFDANGNEYIDINHNGFITDELETLSNV